MAAVEEQNKELARARLEALSRADVETFRGDRYQQTYHFRMRVRDGQIIEWREYIDTDLAREILVREA